MENYLCFTQGNINTARIITIWIFTDKNEYVKRNVDVKLETTARVLDAHIIHREKESFHEYLRSAANIITKNLYSDVVKLTNHLVT